jgi:MFS transporter, ACS family, tartrate transporter
MLTTARAAAGAIVLIDAIGNLADSSGSHLTGWVKDATGNTSTGFVVRSALSLIGGLLVSRGHDTKVAFA